jgi:hypothetical protein
MCQGRGPAAAVELLPEEHLLTHSKPSSSRVLGSILRRDIAKVNFGEYH